MYCVYGNSGRYIHGGPLFGGGPLLGGSVIGGSTVFECTSLNWIFVLCSIFQDFENKTHWIDSHWLFHQFVVETKVQNESHREQ